MRRISKPVRGLFAILALSSVAACEDELPTATGRDLFPEGALLATIDLLLPASEFLVSDTVLTDFTDPREAPFMVVANEFDGVLDAHALARFTGFPDSVTFSVNDTARTDTAFTFGAGRVVAQVNRAASDTTAPITLRLWTLAQTWDVGEATWILAENSELWREPGGTTGELLAETRWVPSDTATADSVVWQVGPEVVELLAGEGFPGVLISSADPGSRIQFSELVLRTAVTPASQPDTAIAQTISEGPRTFIFTPEPPEPGEEAWAVGGITSDRTLLRIALPDSVSTCAPSSADVCELRRVALGDVTLNRATLVLDPRPVPNGFRPLSPIRLTARQVVEPELGRRAPLGAVVARDSVPASAFLPATDTLVELSLARQADALIAGDTASLVLLGEPGAANFGYAWFTGTPKLRLVYTLPLTSRLP